MKASAGDRARVDADLTADGKLLVPKAIYRAQRRVVCRSLLRVLGGGAIEVNLVEVREVGCASEASTSARRKKRIAFLCAVPGPAQRTRAGSVDVPMHR